MMMREFCSGAYIISFTLALLSGCGGGGGGNTETPTPPAATSVSSAVSSLISSASPSSVLPSSASSLLNSSMVSSSLASNSLSTSSSLPSSSSLKSSSVSSAKSSIIAKSQKRGIAYDLASPEDLAVLSTGVSWWYNWGTRANTKVPANYQTQYTMDYYPMLWNGNFNGTDVENFLQNNPSIKYILVLNEPNLTDQANLSPAKAAELWPRYEAIAAHVGVKIVGPAMTWGTMTDYRDPVVWLDAFYAAYRAANNNRDPQIDYLAFHWYDYGLGGQLDRLTKYGKPFWVTEFANWHSQQDGAQIDTLAKQMTQMTELVATCEDRADVFRYAWFIGRMNPDPHFTSLLGANGQLTELGTKYINLPFK